MIATGSTGSSRKHRVLKIKREYDYFEITSNGEATPFYDEINCGESGLGIRMFTPIAALSSLPITIEGHGSLTTRPMDFF